MSCLLLFFHLVDCTVSLSNTSSWREFNILLYSMEVAESPYGGRAIDTCRSSIIKRKYKMQVEMSKKSVLGDSSLVKVWYSTNGKKN